MSLLRIQRQLINEIKRSGDWNQAIDSILVLQSEIEAAIGLINFEKASPLKFAKQSVEAAQCLDAAQSAKQDE